jgi:hypothetical protein
MKATRDGKYVTVKYRRDGDEGAPTPSLVAKSQR